VSPANIGFPFIFVQHTWRDKKHFKKL